MDHIPWWRQTGFCEKFLNSDYFESSNSNYGSTFCFVLKMSSTSFPTLSDFYSDVNFVLSGFGCCQHCVDVDYIANTSEELATVVPRVNVSSMEVTHSSETVDALAPFHIFWTCSSKMDDLKDRRGYSFEGGGSRSHYVEELFWRRLWTCRHTEYWMNE